MEAAATARGGRPRLHGDAVELSDDDVLARVCDILDRKLFEASVTQDVTTIATDVHGFEETVAAEDRDACRAALDLAHAQRVYRQAVIGYTPPQFLLN